MPSRGYWPVLLGADGAVALTSRYRHQRDWRLRYCFRGAALTAAALLQSLPGWGGEAAWNATADPHGWSDCLHLHGFLAISPALHGCRWDHRWYRSR